MSVIFPDDMPDAAAAKDPLLVMAFAGWNDAAEAATAAARHLVEQFGGRQVARIPPEEFFQFSEQRPFVRLDESGKRHIMWQSNEFFHCRAPGLSRDLIVGVGIEPHLKWKRFSLDVLEIANRLGARMIVTMGALLAPGLHSQPSELMAITTDPALTEPADVESTPYEGPTGIVGVIHTLMQDEGLPAVSLWVNVPHYIASLPNPKATRALLEKLGAIGNVEIPLEDFGAAIEMFDERIDQVIARNPRIAQHLEDIGEGRIPEEIADMDFESAFTEMPDEEEGNLPPGDQVADEIERLLRRRPEEPEAD